MLCDPSRKGWNPKEYNVFVPIAIASIGPLYRMQTVEERSIALHLKRATASEIRQLSKGRSRELRALLEPLAKRCARWAVDNAESLKNNARPVLPDGMNGREQDKWEPFIAIADSLGSRWGRLARNVAIAMSSSHDDDDQPMGVLLLKDIRELFEAKNETLIADDRLVQGFIRTLSKCPNWDSANRRADILPLIKRLTEAQIDELVAAYNGNGELQTTHGFTGLRPGYGQGLAWHLTRLGARRFHRNNEGKIEEES